jgi:hypothetical protein
MSELDNFHRPGSKTVFDSYLDKTYGWEREFYLNVGILPMKVKWVGVFHHTYNTEYSPYNLVNVFKDPLFIESLEFCGGIIVLSEHLAKWIRQKLVDISFVAVPVHVLYHPTELDVPKFNWNYFRNRVVQIGAWLRNTYGIYQLGKLDKLQRCVLKGKKMDNYYLECGQQEECCISRGVTENKLISGIRDIIKESEVEIIEHLNNDEYDKLLSNSVVFIKLVDASAVNTIIECIARNTPIVVNRLPALEEYLGNKYPLFYDTIEDARDLLNNRYKLKNGHKYLSKLDKSKISIDTFTQSFKHI